LLDPLRLHLLASVANANSIVAACTTAGQEL
jgi:hypothetical protein